MLGVKRKQIVVFVTRVYIFKQTFEILAVLFLLIIKQFIKFLEGI